MAPVGVPVRVHEGGTQFSKKDKRERRSLDLDPSQQRQNTDGSGDREGVDKPDTPQPFGSRSPLPKRLKMRLERPEVPAEDIAARVDARSLRRPSPIGARRTTPLDDEFDVDSFDVVDSKSEAVATRSILRDASSGEWSKWRYRSNDELAATLDALHARYFSLSRELGHVLCEALGVTESAYDRCVRSCAAPTACCCCFT